MTNVVKLTTAYLLGLFLLSTGVLSAQVVESALDRFNSYCQPENDQGGVQEVSNFVRRGSGAFLHSVQATLPRRAELDDCAFHNYHPDRRYWYGFSLYLPDASFQGNFEQYVAQWRFSNLAFGTTKLNCEMLRECGGSSNFGGSGHHLTVLDQKWRYTVAAQDPDCPTCEGLDHVDMDLAPIQTNVWTDFVIEAEYSHDQDGFINIWMQVDGEGYQLVRSYTGRNWLEFYQEGSGQRLNGVLEGRVMAPNHTVGLYYGSDAGARQMYSDEIRTYQEEPGVDGFTVVSIDGVSRPADPAPVGPQRWRYENLFDRPGPTVLEVPVRPLNELAEGGFIGLSHHSAINNLEDLAAYVHYSPSGKLMAVDGPNRRAFQDLDYAEFRWDTLYFETNDLNYSAGILRNGDTLWIARNYGYANVWTGSGPLTYFTYHTEGGGLFDIGNINDLRACPAPDELVLTEPASENFQLAFSLSADGKARTNSLIGLGADAGAMGVEDLPVHLRLNAQAEIEVWNGTEYTAEEAVVVSANRSYPLTLSVDTVAGTFTLTALVDGRLRTIVREQPFTGTVVTPNGMTTIRAEAGEDGCLQLEDLDTNDNVFEGCPAAGWTPVTYPTRAGEFVIEHGLRLETLNSVPLYAGLTTDRTVTDTDDLAAYVTILPGGLLSVKQGSFENTDVGFYLVPGADYTLTWRVNAQQNRFGVDLIDAFGRVVTLTPSGRYNSTWRNPSNAFARFATFSASAADGCLRTDNLLLNPCGPVEWQAIPLPQRANGTFRLTMDLLAKGGSFNLGEMALSATRVPTPGGTMAQVFFDSTGVILARDGQGNPTATGSYRFNPGTRIKGEWLTNDTTQTFSFNAGRFNPNISVAEGFRFNDDWNGTPPAFLIYRTYDEGCLEITSLLEGESCGPQETWDAKALFTPVSGRDNEITVDLTPVGNNFRDGVWGLTHTANPSDFNSLAAIIQFSAGGLIRVRDGDGYRADRNLPYVYGNTYTLRLRIDAQNRRYSVAQILSGDVIPLATDYAFRADWTGSGDLTHVAKRTVTAGCLDAASDALVSTAPNRRDLPELELRYYGEGRFRIEGGADIGKYAYSVYGIDGRLFSRGTAEGRTFRIETPRAGGIYVVQVLSGKTAWRATGRIPIF